MRWVHRQAALMDLELLLFSVGGVRLAAPLERVAGVLTDVNLLADGEEPAAIPFQGQEVPLVTAENLFDVGAHTAAHPGAVILFRNAHRMYAVAVDSADDVLRVTPGDRLYRFLPDNGEWSTTRRPWGFIELGDVPILLVDFGAVRMH